MKKVLIALLSLGILGGGGYAAYRYFFADIQTTDRVSSSSEDAVYVDSVSAVTGYGSGNGLIERYGGEVEPQATLEVKLENERKVEECFVKEGDTVKEGQRLFAYDTQEDEDKLAQAEIEIERAQGEIEVSQKSIEQNEKDRKNAGADEQLTYTTYILQEQNNIKQKEYEIKQKQLEMDQLKERISDAVVTAEMAGIVQKINDSSTSNAYSYSGDESSAYITILAAGDFRIKGTINEQNLNSGLIYEGMEMLVYSRVNEEQIWAGTITEIKTDNKEEENNSYYYYGDSAGSSNYAFYVDLEDSEGLILGQHVYLEENVGQDSEKDGLWLEEYYITQEDDRAWVWAADAKDLLEKREVTLGEFDEEQLKYEITDGLTAEDYIAYPSEGMSEGTPVIYNDFSSNAGDALAEDWSDDGEDFGDEWTDDDEDWSDDGEDFDDEWADDDEDLGEDVEEDWSDEEVYDLDQETELSADEE